MTPGGKIVNSCGRIAIDKRDRKSELCKVLIKKGTTTMKKFDFNQGIVDMQPELYRFAMKLTADYDSANDLVQDCMLQALGNKEKFVHSENFKGWMYTLMRNIFVNNYRRAAREMAMIDHAYSLSQQHLIESEDAGGFEYAYDTKQLYKAVQAVPQQLKKPLLMFVAGFKYVEIAEKMNLPIGTVKSRLFFVRKRLQQDLKDFS